MTAATVTDDRSVGAGRSEDEARRRAERRAFIRATHPDTGGDPQAFIDGLAGFDARTGPSSRLQADPTAQPRPRVHRSRRPDRIVLRTLRDLRRRAAGQPPRRLQ